MVKVEVLETPASIDQGGRWAVQIGAFDGQHAATELRDHLARRYHTARVQEFPSPTGAWWVRVRVLQDDKSRAEEVARDTHSPEGAVFLVRLD
jgi:rare lipoprotein A